MKILMLAPEPFFETRGTPFSVFHRSKALGRLGHNVDLVVYHTGKRVSIDNVDIHRIPAVPFVKQIAIGPSLVKIPLDIVMFLKAFQMLLKTKYDCIHVHEEAALLGCILKKIFRVPQIYDMHSSIPQQLVNFNFTKNKALIKLALFGEKYIINNSEAVIAICPQLGEAVRSIDSRKKSWIIENPPVSEYNCSVFDKKIDEFRSCFGGQNKKIILYTGTFEPYQGIDLLIKTAPAVIKKIPDVLYILVGGEDYQIREMEKLSEELEVKDQVIFTGKRPVEEMPLFMGIADILASPRVTGTNTPLKIYSYLESGKPIVATNLPTHTQVLNEEIAVLTGPNQDDFAAGILRILTNEALGRDIGRRAKEISETKYSYSSYLAKTGEVYEHIASLRGC
ncbi:glycosyltransferase [Candidatus Methanoperedens nitroreducens]|uniref:Glycosyltransferase n=1 Tax=Candidatus Methanoperedens nitratireducens TaxID=1392998 RepID=A0A062VAD3_9EURY|nr:glycosyltransferase family 4 protein [Candidatus Methanoperedens nitroreducens]KCZ72300.1 glycosyltransferase [Candidatus Methanoperedens nitroreducens]MDJ1420764.1 glycosyltransferase family 4 protein [Candidatus Methanoperedens sp.]